MIKDECSLGRVFSRYSLSLAVYMLIYIYSCQQDHTIKFRHLTRDGIKRKRFQAERLDVDWPAPLSFAISPRRFL